MRSCGRGYVSFPRTVHAGGIGVPTPKPSRPDIGATSKRSTVCGVKKAYGCLRNVGNAAARVQRRSRQTGARLNG